MIYPIIKFIFNRRYTASSVRKATIEIEILFQGKRKRFSTGIMVYKNQWDPGVLVVNHPEARSLNMQLEGIKKSVSDYINMSIIKGDNFTADELFAEINKKKQDNSFIDYLKEKTASRKDIKEITRKNHNRLYTALMKYKKIVTFDDLTPTKIRQFDEWLHEQDYTQTTVAVYHKFMKNYIHLAMADEIITSDPYAGIRIDKGKHKQRKYLTEEEIAKIRALETDDPSVKRARDLFIFQCYTGLAYADLTKFDFKNVIEKEGKYIVRDIRQKTEEEFYIVLLPPALEVLKKYNYALPIISNQKYNSSLKAVAAGAGIKRTVTSHMGRHTFASYCINHGIPIETLATMLGHSNIKATQIYSCALWV